MTHGNAFGAAGGDWMPDSLLRVLLENGVSYEDIAVTNETLTGWRPHKSSVLNRARRMGIERRRASHVNLIPWRIRPEHQNHIIRHMLTAESRRQQGLPVSEDYAYLAAALDRELNGGKHRKVVTYDPETGFAYALREPTDVNIVRMPKSRQRLRKELKAR